MPRKSDAYLQKSNWPECIPWTEPTRKSWPFAWYYDPTEAGPDDYPSCTLKCLFDA